MTSDTARIIVELRAGEADQLDVGLSPGEPVEAFSIGQNGSWRIQAPGLADVHAYMYFDGATLYLASVNAADPAWINGRPVPTDWQAIVPPCEIAMGSARLWAELEEEFDVEPDEPEPAPAAMPRPRKPKRPKISPPKLDESTAMSALRAPAPAPAQGAGAERKRDKVRQIKIRQSVREAPPDEESTRLAPIDVANAPVGPQAPLPAAGRPPEHVSAPVQPQAIPAPGPPIPGGYPPSVQPPGPSAYAPSPGPPIPGPPVGFVPPGVTAQPVPPQPFGAAPVPAPFPPGVPFPGVPQPAPTPLTTTTPTASKGVGAKLVESWKQASIPQKAILVLMPFAIGAMFVIFDDKSSAPQRPSKPATAHSASAAPVASTSARAAAVESATATEAAPPPPPVETSTEAVPGKPTRRLGKEAPKSEQREAADLVAAGNFAEAASAYEKLAAAHPDVPAYREAARILKEKASANPK